MVDVELRIGRFTSSNIHKLMTKDRSGKGFGAPAKTYIEEKRAERFLGRSVELGTSSQEMTWGKVMEYWAFENVMGLEYSLCSKDTIVHPKYRFWTGTPDYTKENTAGEMKCFYPKRYYTLSKALLELNDSKISLEEFKGEFGEIYWQVVSNASILGFDNCEIMAFTPTEEQLLQIREEIEETNLLELAGVELWQGRFIVESPLHNLPYIPSHSKWPNMVKFTFQPTKEDLDSLEGNVIKAEKLLTE